MLSIKNFIPEDKGNFLTSVCVVELKKNKRLPCRAASLYFNNGNFTPGVRAMPIERDISGKT
jgi:hypothetical protein